MCEVTATSVQQSKHLQYHTCVTSTATQWNTRQCMLHAQCYAHKHIIQLRVTILCYKKIKQYQGFYFCSHVLVCSTTALASLARNSSMVLPMAEASTSGFTAPCRVVMEPCLIPIIRGDPLLAATSSPG